MKIKYQVIVKDGKVVDQQYFEAICCDTMRMALLKQETPFGKDDVAALWLYCPFCKKEIEY